MVRLRDAVMAVALATGGVGCATFCDECDDFPVPGGPGGYSMMPGTYTGPPLMNREGQNSSTAMVPGPAAAAGAGVAPAASPAAPVGDAAPTPPVPPSASPRGAATSAPAAGITTTRYENNVSQPLADPLAGLPTLPAADNSLPPLP